MKLNRLTFLGRLAGVHGGAAGLAGVPEGCRFAGADEFDGDYVRYDELVKL